MDGYTFTFVFLATMATLGVTAGLPATSNKISSLENLGSLNGTEYYRDSSHKHVVIKFPEDTYLLEAMF